VGDSVPITDRANQKDTRDWVYLATQHLVGSDMTQSSSVGRTMGRGRTGSKAPTQIAMPPPW